MIANPVFLFNMLEKAAWHEHKIAKGKKAEKCAYSEGQDLRKRPVPSCARYLCGDCSHLLSTQHKYSLPNSPDH